MKRRRRLDRVPSFPHPHETSTKRSHQQTTRLGSVWAESWTTMSNEANTGSETELGRTQTNKGRCTSNQRYVPPTRCARKKFERSAVPAMPCLPNIKLPFSSCAGGNPLPCGWRRWRREGGSNPQVSAWRNQHHCAGASSVEQQRTYVEKEGQHMLELHQDHLDEKYNSLYHFGLVHSPIPMTNAVKILVA